MPAALIGEVESPRPLRVPGGRLRVVGWCVARGIATAPAVRLSAAAITLAAHGNRARPDVAALLPAEPAAGTSGFSLEGDLPAIAAALNGVDVLTYGATAAHAAKGTVVGFDLEESKPKLVVNPARAKAQNVSFKAELLKLARLVG